MRLPGPITQTLRMSTAVIEGTSHTDSSKFEDFDGGDFDGGDFDSEDFDCSG